MKTVTIQISEDEANSIALLATDPATGDARDDVRVNAVHARILRAYILGDAPLRRHPSRDSGRHTSLKP